MIFIVLGCVFANNFCVVLCCANVCASISVYAIVL